MNPHSHKLFRDDDELAAALTEMRPEIDPAFAAELDAWAEAGCPRRAGGARSRAAGLLDRLRATPPRRILAPAGALATLAIVATTAVVVGIGSDGAENQSTEDGGNLLSLTVPAEDASSSDEGAAEQVAPAGMGESAAGAEPATSDSMYAAPVPTRPSSGPYASETRDRAIERSADVVIGTDPERIRGAAGQVFDAVHAADGIVLNSSIREGEAGTARADFELLIPSGKLGDALADFSAIGEVRSRNESTQDITAPTVGVGERLQDTQARIDGLLAQLAEADSDGERVRVEAELRDERFRAAALKSRLSDLERRANFSRVSLRIETGAASSSPDADEGGAWGVSDGLDDAGRVLEVAAAVTLVGLAILAPFALIALLAWLAHRAWLRRTRDQTLARP